MALHDDFRLTQIAGEPYLVKTLATTGYQGFFGLPWYGHVAKRVTTAFGDGGNGGNGTSLDARTIRANAIFSGRLVQVEEASENVLSDLELVVQNGEIMAAKKSFQADPSERVEAHALPHVLNEVKKIGDQVQHVFQDSTDGLLRLVTSSRLHDVRFLAQLAIDIMDRNLYERANDCRWWALTSEFRRILDKPAPGAADTDRMREILSYINGLYTVYTNLFVYDRTGRILACSNPGERRLEGRLLDAGFVPATLRLADSQSYASRISNPPTCTPKTASPGRPTSTTPPSPPLSARARSSAASASSSTPRRSFCPCSGTACPGTARETSRRGPRACSWSPGDGSSPRPIRTTPRGKSWSFPGLPGTGRGPVRLPAGRRGGRAPRRGLRPFAGYREYKRDGAYTNDLLAIVTVRI
jgi:hypothetical protein